MKNEQPNSVVFVEVPKPINEMSKKEKDLFIEQIIEALGDSSKKVEEGVNQDTRSTN